MSVIQTKSQPSMIDCTQTLMHHCYKMHYVLDVSSGKIFLANGKNRSIARSGKCLQQQSMPTIILSRMWSSSQQLFYKHHFTVFLNQQVPIMVGSVQWSLMRFPMRLIITEPNLTNSATWIIGGQQRTWPILRHWLKKWSMNSTACHLLVERSMAPWQYRKILPMLVD